MSFIMHPGKVHPFVISQYNTPLYVGVGDDAGLFLFETNNSPMNGFVDLLKYVIAPSCGAVYTTKIGYTRHVFGITPLYTGQSSRVFYNMDALESLYLYYTDGQWVISSDFLDKSDGYYYSKQLPKSLGESTTFRSSKGYPSITLTLDFPCWTCATLCGVYEPRGTVATKKVIGVPETNEEGLVIGYTRGDSTTQVYIGDIAVWR